MSKYKLTYFNVRGVGEPLRLIFIVAGIPFEDEQLNYSEWERLKSTKKMGFGQLPILTIDGSRQMTQSLTIGRFLGKRFGLVPADEWLAARCDEVVEFLTELRLEFRKVYLEQDANLKKELSIRFKTTIAPKYYGILSELVGEEDGPFTCGPNLSWVDCFLANWIEIFEEHELGPEFKMKYPALKRVQDAVYGLPAVKEYLEKRVKTVI